MRETGAPEWLRRRRRDPVDAERRQRAEPREGDARRRGRALGLRQHRRSERGLSGEAHAVQGHRLVGLAASSKTARSSRRNLPSVEVGAGPRSSSASASVSASRAALTSTTSPRPRRATARRRVLEVVLDVLGGGAARADAAGGSGGRRRGRGFRLLRRLGRAAASAAAPAVPARLARGLEAGRPSWCWRAWWLGGRRRPWPRRRAWRGLFFLFLEKGQTREKKREVREDESTTTKRAKQQSQGIAMHRVVLALFDSDEQLRSAGVENTSRNRP